MNQSLLAKVDGCSSPVAQATAPSRRNAIRFEYRFSDRARRRSRACPQPPGVNATTADWPASSSRAARAAAISFFASLATIAVDCSRSEEHTSELQSLMRISYVVFCLKEKHYRISTTYYPSYDTIIT